MATNNEGDYTNNIQGIDVEDSLEDLGIEIEEEPKKQKLNVKKKVPVQQPVKRPIPVPVQKEQEEVEEQEIEEEPEEPLEEELQEQVYKSEPKPKQQKAPQQEPQVQVIERRICVSQEEMFNEINQNLSYLVQQLNLLLQQNQELIKLLSGGR